MRRLAVLLLAPSLIAAAPSAGTTACSRIGDGLHPAAGLPTAGGFRRLDQLPPANEYLTVLRSEDGCQKPVIVRYDVDRKPASGR
jgi:hypothetical protein